LVKGTSPKRGGVHRAAIAWASGGAAIEERGSSRRDATKRMDKRNAMNLSPGPVFGIEPQLRREFFFSRA
jgi:hypothetical protein